MGPFCVGERCEPAAGSDMVGAAVERHPELAKEIVQRGHEATGHGQTWTAQFLMTREGERRTYEQLQDLGFIYHIDDVSRDEPFR
jgi:hypothetical protein